MPPTHEAPKVPRTHILRIIPRYIGSWALLRLQVYGCRYKDVELESFKLVSLHYVAALPQFTRDLLYSAPDFPAQSHPIHYMYGLTDFIVLTPKGKEDVSNLTRAKVSTQDNSNRKKILIPKKFHHARKKCTGPIFNFKFHFQD